jgi:raffinose/stachyose/melibiose transport system substrate-binding protein
MARKRVRTALALGAAAALLAACGTTDDPGGTNGASPTNGGNGGNGGQGEDVTITWWHNGTGEPLVSFWEEIAREFEDDNPGVTVEVQAFQNEELQRTLIPNALRSNDPPDLFQSWGAGELAEMVRAGYVRDLTDDVQAEADAIGGTAAPWQIEGRTYGLPYTFGISGFWYNQELFDEAGIEGTPETLEELYEAIEQLKAADITPIAVGAGDGWPAAHYWYHFALKSCSPEVLERAQAELVFDDPCFVEAGELLEEFIASEPFNEGYLATSAQQGAGSSAGMVATGTAAMELMGHWNPGVMGGILADETGEDTGPPEFLGWVNFPAIDGAQGDATAALGGGDGFSVSANAPDATVDLLRYIASEDVQTRFGQTGAGMPVTPGSEGSIEDPNLQQVLEGLQNATYVQLWLDTAYGAAVGGAMNEAIVNFFGGQGSPESIVEAIQSAVDTL